MRWAATGLLLLACACTAEEGAPPPPSPQLPLAPPPVCFLTQGEGRIVRRPPGSCDAARRALAPHAPASPDAPCLA